MKVKIDPIYLLGFLFIVLKLVNVIDWDWIWVMAPFWLPITIYLSACLIAIAILMIFYAFEDFIKK